MRVGDVEIAVFARPLRAQMTHDEFLTAYEGVAMSLENSARAEYVRQRPRYPKGDLELAARMRAKVDAVRFDPTATRRLAESRGVHLSEDVAPDPGTVHAVNVFGAAAALVAGRPPRALCGAPLPSHEPVHGVAEPCPRCAGC